LLSRLFIKSQIKQEVARHQKVMIWYNISVVDYIYPLQSAAIGKEWAKEQRRGGRRL
jgi:hypothetical protein